jgi:hypothetical protein
MKRFRPWIPVLLLPLFAACGESQLPGLAVNHGAGALFSG